MTMNLKVWKTPNVAEAKKLVKMPEYNEFVKKLAYYQLHEDKKNNLKEDATKLLEAAEIKDEKSKPMALLEKANESSKKIKKLLAIAGGIGMVAAIAIGSISPVARVFLDVLGKAGAFYGGMGFAVLCAIFVTPALDGISGRFEGTLSTFKKAIGIAKGEQEA